MYISPADNSEAGESGTEEETEYNSRQHRSGYVVQEAASPSSTHINMADITSTVDDSHEVEDTHTGHDRSELPSRGPSPTAPPREDIATSSNDDVSGAPPCYRDIFTISGRNKTRNKKQDSEDLPTYKDAILDMGSIV